MLTGPITILRWSFPRDDVPQSVQAKQLGLALRDEVSDLEKAGISVIQVDEPALREGCPLRRSEWDAYLKWAVDSFRIATASVEDDTQIHSHFCYSDFNDIFWAIKALDADVISIENSKSDLKLLNVFERESFGAGLGPGLYDIHSPRVPSVEEMAVRLAAMRKYLPDNSIWLNPDCGIPPLHNLLKAGLKTRQWPETKAALENLVKVARQARETVANA
jgi:5-methyltetrahydropteroyltriglutamate--homocysteine methyltransferase